MTETKMRPQLQEMSVADLTANWRPDAHDANGSPIRGRNPGWTWADAAYDLLVETRPYYQAGVLTRVRTEGIGFADDYAPITLGHDGRVWDGHHRIVAAMALGISTVMVHKVTHQQISNLQKIRIPIATIPPPPCSSRHSQFPKSLATCSLPRGHVGAHEVRSILNTLMFSWPRSSDDSGVR